MANPLTGDFDAVLQVSGSTVNRLLACMHQNGGGNTSLPSFAHSAYLRVGDGLPIDGMRGSVWAQVSVPRIELIHGSSDRFWLEVVVRARYKPDPGSTPLPEFIHGTVKAQYRLEGVDPNCWGWAKNASEYLWIRVVGDSVSFNGTAYDDELFTIATGIDQVTADARITRLITVLLKTQFEATPHRVSAGFQRGMLRSLNVGVSGSVVAVPISLAGAPPAGDIGSITQDLLEGSDFGLGISREYILSKIQPVLDDLKAGFKLFFHYGRKDKVLGITVLTVSIDWTITLTKATATWVTGVMPFGGASTAFIAIEVSGQGITADSEYNWSFDATQLVAITFDAAEEKFVLAKYGAPIVVVHAGGDYADEIRSNAKPQIEQRMGPEVQNAINQFGAFEFAGHKTPLIDELKKIDASPDAHFDEAVFSADGASVRGRVILSQRHSAANLFALAPALNAFDAFGSWIPGGRVDALEWSWHWFNNAGDAGSYAGTDRFLLRRPLSPKQGKFGAAIGLKRPLPGLDGSGRVCLNVRGVQVHAITGQLVPVATGRRCSRFGVDVRIGLNIGPRLFIREYVPAPRDPEGPMREVALIEVGGGASHYASNTLVLYVDRRWNRETAVMLRDGLAMASRLDAGLQVLVLFRDGALAAGGQQLLAEIAEMTAELEAPILVNEDVNGGWSEALSFRSGSAEPGWRLISPTGGVAWVHEGPIEPQQLARELDTYLFPSAPAGTAPISPGPPPGSLVGSVALSPSYVGVYHDLENPCPPPPLGRLGKGSVVTFVQPDSAASKAHLHRLASEYRQREDRAPFVAVIVDRAKEKEAQALKSELPEGFAIVSDPEGVIARRFGVRIWPSTATLNNQGMLTQVDMGLDPDEPKVEEAK